MTNVERFARISLALVVVHVVASCERAHKPDSLEVALARAAKLHANASPSEFRMTEESLKLFSDQQDLRAMVALGRISLFWHDASDEQTHEGLELLKHASDAGSGEASLALALAHTIGAKNLVSDQVEAVRWARLSAWQGNVDGMSLFGGFLRDGVVVSKNEIEGRAWTAIAKSVAGSHWEKHKGEDWYDPFDGLSPTERLDVERKSKELNTQLEECRRLGRLPAGL